MAKLTTCVARNQLYAFLRQIAVEKRNRKSKHSRPTRPQALLGLEIALMNLPASAHL